LLLAASKTTAEEEHDGCEGQTGPCAPREAKCISADAGSETSILEAVAGHDEFGAEDSQ